jgi:TPR repeat protein
MTALRAALVLALLAACPAAWAQPSDASDVAPPLRVGVSAYRAGDLPTAEFLLRKLAPENADAEAWLGAVLLDRGNNAEGLRVLQHAVDAGSSEAAQRLAVIFAEGLSGTPRNDTRAAELFEKAAAAGNQRAQINIGILYFRGQGVSRDLMQSRAWLEKAAAGDDPFALYALGRVMEISDGAAVADFTRAADLYRRAAEKGHPLAALRYGLALQEGSGVRRDLAAAQKWITYALNSGVPEAALALGDLIARSPASRDKAANDAAVRTALNWYESAANAGIASAQFKVGNAYFAGAGVARDPAQALLWYSRAAQQGLPDAQHALGIMLIGGVAGPADPVEGYKWLLLAERSGKPDAALVREKAAEQIGPQDRKRAEALAQSFAATVERPADDLPPRLGRTPAK